MSKKSSTPALCPSTLAALHVVEFAEGKKHYKTADFALQVLASRVKIGRVITVPNQASISIVTDEAIRKLEIPEEFRGKKFRLRSKGNFFPVGQTARAVELEEVS